MDRFWQPLRRRLAPALVILCVWPLSGHADATDDVTQQARRLDVLIVLYTRSFSQTLTPDQLERVHEEVFEFVDFYRAAAGDAVDFNISLLQIDRELTLAGVSEVAPGRYYLAREDIQHELVALGMLDHEFDEVIALYAWNNANPEGAALAYGGGAVGPDGNFLGDAGYNSIGVFASDPGSISRTMIHEVLHNIDDMFSMSGMPDAFLNSDEMSRNMPALLSERPGAFLPHYDDGGMASYAERELANRATYPWSMQLVYYGWMLRRTAQADWLKLDYGRLIEVQERDRGARPLYDRIFVSRANQEVYVPVISAGSRTPPALLAGSQTFSPERRTYEHTDFDGSVLFEGTYYAAWISPPDTAERIAVRVGESEAEISMLGMGELAAPSNVVTFVTEMEAPYTPPGPPEEHGQEAAAALHETVASGAQIDEGTLQVEAREARFGGGGPLMTGVTLTATIDSDTLAHDEHEQGRFALELTSLGLGTHRLRLSAEAPDIVFVPRLVEVERRYAWSIYAEREMVAGNGAPIDVTIRIARDLGVGGARVTATVGGRELELRELPNGRYSVVVEEGLLPGLDTIRVRAEMPGAEADEAEVLERDIPVYVEPRGWIEVPSRIGAGADSIVTLQARVRDWMGRVVEGAGLPIAIVIGPELVVMNEEDASGVYSVRFEPPEGEHRVYVISLEGNYERRVVLLEVRRDE
jgi:hypothetical protein